MKARELGLLALAFAALQLPFLGQALVIDDGSFVDVEFSERQNPRIDDKYSVEITTNVAGHIVRIEADAPDQKSALDTAADKYERQLRRLKERLIQRSRPQNGRLLDEPPADVDDAEPAKPVVRTKTFDMRPMSVEEAVLQMEMLGHDFFFFLDADSGKHCVLYHRKDGDLGLIEPS